jgi:hypothetical protein
MVRNRAREEHLGVAPLVRPVVTQHERAQQPTAVDERDEGERLDPLGAHQLLEPRVEAGLSQAVDEHRFGIGGVGSPGRVPFGAGTVRVREPAPRAEAQDPVVVGQEHGRPVRTGCREQRVDRLREQLVERGGARDRVRDPVEGVDLGNAPAQLLVLADVTRRIREIVGDER